MSANSKTFPFYSPNGAWNLEEIKKDGKTFYSLTPELEKSCLVCVVKHLLKQRIDINCPNFPGDSPLVVALKNLLEGGAGINCPNCAGEAPLVVALENSIDEAVIRMLLEGGVEVNKMDPMHGTPLLRYLRRKDCSVSIVKLLLDFKADVNQKDSFGESPLKAAIRNSEDEVIRMLVEKGAEVNSLGNTMLLACEKCSVDTLKLLLAKGADINCVNENGRSPLLCAISCRRDNAIIQDLLENGANANVFDKFGQTPLALYLANYSPNNCSNDVVNLLLHRNANVNRRHRFTESPLMIALKQVKDEEVIKTLLAAGARDSRDFKGRPSLCIAFSYCSNDIVKLLLDLGFSPNACKYHMSALHCATDFPNSGLRGDILQLLLEEATIEVNSADGNGQSVLCFALQHGAKSSDIQLLLNSGASLNDCAQHSSPLICVTKTSSFHTPLSEDVVKLLLDNGASVKKGGLNVLQYALRCKYDTGAIQLLLDIPGMESYIFKNKLILHHALSNPNCNLDVIKLLIDRKAQVLSINEMGETPLHCGAKNKSCDPSIINLLIKKGSPVNASSTLGETALTLAVKKHCFVGILTELLFAGASFEIDKARCEGKDKHELLILVAKNWETCENENLISSYKLLVKFFLLQNPKFNMKEFQNDPTIKKLKYMEKFENFVGKCLNEVGKMESLKDGSKRTFRMFLSQVEMHYDMNIVLSYLTENLFPVFFDVIVARIGRSVMEAQLNKPLVYANKINPVGRVYLNSDILRKITKDFPDDDLLNFIIAFYEPAKQNHIGGTRKTYNFRGKRKSKPSSELNKRPKLYL